MPDDTVREAAEPITLNLVVQMADLHSPNRPDHNFAGDLAVCAEQFCGYFVKQLQGINEPRGGDLFVAVQLQRGTETAGWQYREGRYVKDGEPDASAG